MAELVAALIGLFGSGLSMWAIWRGTNPSSESPAETMLRRLLTVSMIASAFGLILAIGATALTVHTVGGWADRNEVVVFMAYFLALVIVPIFAVVVPRGRSLANPQSLGQ